MDIIDNAQPPPPPDDPRQEDGRSALLLVESLIHGLIAAEAIDRPHAIEIVNIAVEIGLELAHERGADPLAAAVAVRGLTAIERTLRSELPQAASLSAGPT